MSDQRFEGDLRSVLLEEAPREVPDDLRRRVAAVSATHPVASGPSRPARRHPVPFLIGGLAALAIVLVAVAAIAAWWSTSEPGFGGPPSPSPSVEPSVEPSGAPSQSPAPAPSTAPPSAVGSSPSPTSPSSTSVSACRAGDVSARILGWQGAAGSRIADVEVTNTAARPCLVRGTPGLQLLDAAGRVLIDSATAGPSGRPRATSTDAELGLAPGGRLRTQVRTSNYCGPTPLPPIDIAFTLPSGGGRFVAVPGPGVSSTDAGPPCLGGATAGQITMNGWQR